MQQDEETISFNELEKRTAEKYLETLKSEQKETTEARLKWTCEKLFFLYLKKGLKLFISRIKSYKFYYCNKSHL